MAVITLVTGNPKKLIELHTLAPASLQLVSAAIDLPEIQSMDLREIIIDKAKRAYERIGGPIIVEDVSTGLDHLRGLPGPFFKFFEKELGKRALLEISSMPYPAVTIRCLAAYYDGKTMLIGEGMVHGRVVAPRGENGFGFDFTVIPDGETRTISEMTVAEKNAISHRGKAFQSLLQQLDASLRTLKP